jgi:hypothetical protein
VLLLLALNLWSTLALQQRLAQKPAPEPILTAPPPAGDDSREHFAEALYDLLLEQNSQEWQPIPPALLGRYERLASVRPGLRLEAGNLKGKAAVAALVVLAGRDPDRIEELIRRALTDKGYSDALIKAACQQVHGTLQQELRVNP